MFREMRRFQQLLSPEVSRAILERGTSGVLAVLGDEGYPYAVPLSYVCRGDKLYFHCAREGHKMDAVRACPKASFCVIDQDQVVEEEYTTYFRSVIAFGKVRVLEDEGEKRRAIEELAVKYAPLDSAEHRDRVIAREFAQMAILELTMEHLTGKEAIELGKATKPN